MRRAMLWSAGSALAITLVCPAAAVAGPADALIDFIAGMSGPQMFGVPTWCDFTLQADTNDTRYRTPPPRQECGLLGKRLSRRADDDPDGMKFRETRSIWITAGGGLYFSTTEDSDMNHYDWLDVWMLAYEPMLNIRTVNRPNVRIDHGVMGLSYFFMFGNDFKKFSNVGMKFTPIHVSFRYFEVAYNFRVFPTPFTPEQFPNRFRADDPVGGAEIVHGFTFALPLPRF